MKYEYVAYNESVSDDELLSDLKRVCTQCNTGSLTMKQYSNYGKYDCSTFLRRFETWNKSLEKAGIPLTQQYWTEENLFENIENAWIKKGSQPRRRDMDDKRFSHISSGAYLRKFGRWSDALKAFVAYINAEETIITTHDEEQLVGASHRTARDINLRLRFRVLQRDNFTCKACGASPAKDPSVELQVDHIFPWSKGGETEIDNLQTLCSKCNQGKGNML